MPRFFAKKIKPFVGRILDWFTKVHFFDNTDPDGIDALLAFL